MLVGFFKKPLNCLCYIIKFSDRIWLSKEGDAEFLRTFIVTVDKDSANPLEEVRMLLPIKNILDLNDLNSTCFLPPSENYFNAPESYTTRQYSTIQVPINDGRFDQFGIINHDGITNVKVFLKINQSSYQVKDCTVIRFELPTPLMPGETTEIRIKFRINSIFDKVSFQSPSIYFLELLYFPRKYVDEIEQLDRNLVIGIKPTQYLNEKKFIGGFDISLYLPPEFVCVSGFEDHFKKQYDQYDINGKKEAVNRLKYLWRLRELLRKRGMEEDTLITLDEHFAINGVITESYDQRESIGKLSDEIPQKINIQIKKSRLYSIIAIIFALIGIVLRFINLDDLYKAISKICGLGK